MLGTVPRLEPGTTDRGGWLLDHLRDAALVVELGSHRVRYCNLAAEQLFGYAAEDVVGEPIDRLIDDLPLEPHSSAAELGPFERCGHARDGRLLWIETSLSPLPVQELSDTRARCTLLVIRNIAGRGLAARRRTGRALRASQQRLQAALARQRFLDQASRELANSLDYETTLQTVAWLPLPRLGTVCLVQALDDELRLDGTAVAHLDPRRAIDLQHLIDAERPTSPREAPPAPPALLATGTRLVEPAPQASVWSALGLGPHLGEALQRLDLAAILLVPIVGRGRVLGLLVLGAETPGAYDPDTVALAEDLARGCALALEHAALYRTAQQAITARDQFLGIAAHELRAPLTRLKTHAEMLLLAQSEGELDADRVAWSAERINAAVDRLAALTKDMLDVARLRGGQLPFRPSTLDLGELVTDLEPRFAEHLGPAHRLLTTLNADQVCPVLVDQERIEQILLNLLENAAKYSPDGSDVQLSVRRDDGGVVLQVRDGGIGLPPGSHELIFEAFGRAANAERLNVPGMGLGLHICRMIVERHGGRIWATSPGENLGTTISVWLPLAAASTMRTAGDVQERLTTQLTLAAGYCELLATSPELPERLRAQAREAMQGAQGAVATLGHLQQLVG